MKELAMRAVLAAAEVLRDNFGRGQQVRYKGGSGSIVTDVDLESEKTMLDLITASFPDHDIWAEETRPHGTNNHDFRWIIDALDGTCNYVHGNPYFDISLALQYRNETVLSIVYNPITEESFLAERGKGLLHNETPVQMRGELPLGEAVICTDWSHCRGADFDRAMRILHRLHPHVKAILTYGCGGLAAAHVATGVFDAYINIHSHPWDHAAASLIVEEAGGRATTAADEKQWGPSDSVVAANRCIHRQLIETILSATV